MKAAESSLNESRGIENAVEDAGSKERFRLILSGRGGDEQCCCLCVKISSVVNSSDTYIEKNEM